MHKQAEAGASAQADKEHLQLIKCTVCRNLCKWGIGGSMVNYTTSGLCTLWMGPTYERLGHDVEVAVCMDDKFTR